MGFHRTTCYGLLISFFDTDANTVEADREMSADD
jgi:hypothetical protein